MALGVWPYLGRFWVRPAPLWGLPRLQHSAPFQSLLTEAIEEADVGEFDGNEFNGVTCRNGSGRGNGL